MNPALQQFETSAAFGLQWPTWLAISGIVVFSLLGLYAALLFLADKRFLEKYPLLLPATLRSRIMQGFVLAATLPAISLAFVLMDSATSEKLDRTASLLTSQSAAFAEMADYFLFRNIADIRSAAGKLDVDAPAAAADTIRTLQADWPALLSLLFVDADGLVVATTDFGDRRITALPVDRTDLRAALAGERFFVSGFQRHPASDKAHAVAISVPVTDSDGRVSGALIGYLDLDSFRRLNNPILAKAHVDSIVVDSNGIVLFGSDTARLPPGRNLAGEFLLAGAYAGNNQLFQTDWTNAGQDDKRRYLAVGHSLRNGWHVYLYRSLDSLQGAMLADYGVALAWLGATLIISICLALAMATGISGPLETLDRTVREFNLKQPRQSPTPPPGVPLEVRSVFEHLGALDKRVRGAYSKLHKALVQGEKLRGELIYVISNREKEIETRTDELKKANAALERLSREDSLTGLANRRWFAHFLAQTWRTALRDNKAISILIMDIDDFKAYNDAYGHQKGDECLKLVAEAINRTVGRASDLVSRYGGEEFVAILGDTPLEGGLQIAEQIRASVEALQIPHKAAKYHQYVTLSIGVTSTLPTHDTQPETILIAADRAMYNAKHEGKNRVAYSTTARTGTYQSLVMPGDKTSRLS